MKNPLVSVVIPVYNVEKFLEQCLDSVLNQTYDNIEIIAINDGSTDNSLNILEEYRKSHHNILVFSQVNAGQSASRNKGIQRANGKYVHFLDADDYVLPQTYENLVNRMEEHNLDIALFAAEPFVDGVNMKIYKKQYDLSKYFNSEKVYDHKEYLTVLLNGFSVSPCLYLVSKSLLEEGNMFFTPGILHEDELFSLELYLKTNAAMYDPNFYYKRRYRQDSVMTSNQMKHLNRSFDSYWEIIKKMEVMLSNYSGELERKLIKARIGKLYGILSKAELDRNYKNEKLKQINELSLFEKKYYSLKSKIKKIAKKVLLR